MSADPAPTTRSAAPRIGRAAYADVPLYDPKRVPTPTDLSDNTNLWGIPPAAERMLRELPWQRVTRYPSLYAAELKTALAATAGVTPDMVVTGCGSDDILDSAMRAFGDPGMLVAYSDPTFAMVPIFSRMNALRAVGVPELASGVPDVDALLATGADVLYLCAPNNPTGRLIPRPLLERLLRDFPGYVILDEAYIEFAGAGASHVPLLAANPRLLLVRTMSKAYGLAGMRVGYALGQPALVAEVEKSRGPYKVNAIAETVALAALTADRAWVDQHIALAVEHRLRLEQVLREMGLSPIPSSANFTLVPVDACVEVGAAMRARGVAVRPFPALPHVGDALRISVGPWEVVQQAIDALRATLAERGPLQETDTIPIPQATA